jgi:NADH:ubiquinone oxidoreductase subunit 6 (subunit J)
MRAWLYLIAAAIAGAIITTPALLVFVLLGGSGDDALLAGLATLMLAAGIAVVTMRDIIRCGLAMIVCFLALAGIYVILGAPIVAAAQVIVYIGAISVLILFAIMLTQEKVAPARLVFQTQALPAAIAAIVLAVLVALAAVGTDWASVAERLGSGAADVAAVLFDQYILPFEVVSVLLLAAVIGGVFLAKRERRTADEEEAA